MSQDNAGVAIRPPILVAIALALGWGLDALWPWGFGLTTEWRIGFGVVVLAVGLGFAVPAIRLFRRAGTNVPTNRPSTALVIEGPYRLTRNPIYVGLCLLQLAIALFADIAWIAALLAATWAVLNWGVVAREERYLAAKFGRPYLDFVARTRRWF